MRIRIVIAKCLSRVPGANLKALHLILPLAVLAAGTLAASAQFDTNNAVMIGKHAAHPTRILAKFKSETGPLFAASELRLAGSKVQRRFNGLRKLALLEQDDAAPLPASEGERRARLLNRIDALKRTGLFEYVEPDYLLYPSAVPNDIAFTDGTLWGLRNTTLPGFDISAPTAWDITTGSTNVIVAVIDTGVRYTHTELATQMWRNPGEIPGNGIDDDDNGFVDDVFGINAAAGTGNPMDIHDHGTHVAGTIGAAANSGGRHVGVAWNVRIMALKFLDPTGSTADAITCIDYAVEKGAKILNNSWGGGAFSLALFDAINRARSAGVLFVAAAGNEGLDNDEDPHYPSSYPLDNIISVAAIDRFDQLADFSNFGATSVDIAAPGVEIFSCFSGSDNAYAIIDGTSMATPHVSGVAALILAQYPAADLTELRGRLLLSSVQIPSLTGKCTTGARLNAYGALTISGTGILQLTIDPPSGSILLTSSNQTIRVEVSDPPFSVVNATVTGNIPSVTNLTFLNNGAPPDAQAGDRIYTTVLRVPASTNSLVMTVVATAPGKVPATNIVHYTVVPPPVNDFFTNSIKAPAAGATYLSNNRFATLEANEPAPLGMSNRAASLWWSYTPAITTNIFVDTSGSGVDTVLAVYSGNAVSNLIPVAAVDDVGFRKQAYLSFNGAAGSAYRVLLVSADTNAVGSVQLRITPGGAPDTTLPSVFITSPLSGSTTTNNVLTLTGTAADPAPNATGVKEVVVGLAGQITGSAVGTTNWTGTVALNPGVNMVSARAIDGFGNESAAATISVTYYVPGPPNDFFVNGLSLNPTSGSSSVNTLSATKEVGEPAHAGNNGGKSVWWTYTAPQDGVLTLSTLGSSFDTLLGLYQGNSVGSLTLIDNNDDANPGLPGYSQIVHAVSSNQTYRIAVDGYDAVSGTAVLSNSFIASTVYLLVVDSAGGGTVSPASMYVQSNNTVEITATPNAYYQFNNWDGAVNSSANPLSVVVNSNMAVVAHFIPRVFSDDFETGTLEHLPWTTNGPSVGTRCWIIQSSQVAFGSFAARSGFITHNQSSSLLLTAVFHEGMCSFDFRVSSEASFDSLKFFVDGLQIQQWAGNVPWGNFAFPISAGTHTVEWRYAKDATFSAGLDAAFIDNVNLPLGLPIDSTSPAHLDLVQQPDGTFVVNLLGQTNQQYVIQISADLATWENVSTNRAVNGVIQFPDPDSASNDIRFYRAVVSP